MQKSINHASCQCRNAFLSYLTECPSNDFFFLIFLEIYDGKYYNAI